MFVHPKLSGLFSVDRGETRQGKKNVWRRGRARSTQCNESIEENCSLKLRTRRLRPGSATILFGCFHVNNFAQWRREPSSIRWAIRLLRTHTEEVGTRGGNQRPVMHALRSSTNADIFGGRVTQPQLTGRPVPASLRDPTQSHLPSTENVECLAGGGGRCDQRTQQNALEVAIQHSRGSRARR